MGHSTQPKPATGKYTEKEVAQGIRSNVRDNVNLVFLTLFYLFKFLLTRIIPVLNPQTYQEEVVGMDSPH